MAECLLDNGTPVDKYAEPTDYLDFTDSSDSDPDLEDLDIIVQKFGIADNSTQHQQGSESRTLESLPSEIRFKIMKCLDPYSAACLAVTSSAFYGIFRRIRRTTHLMSRFCDRHCGFKPPGIFGQSFSNTDGCFCSFRRKLHLHCSLRRLFSGYRFCYPCAKYKPQAAFDVAAVLVKLASTRFWHPAFYEAFRSLGRKGYRWGWRRADEESAFRAEVDWEAIWPQKLTTEDYNRGTRMVWLSFEKRCCRCCAIFLSHRVHHFQYFDFAQNIPRHAVRLRQKRTSVQDKTGAWSLEGEEVPHQRSKDRCFEGLHNMRGEWGPGHGRYMTREALFEWLGI